MKLSFGITLIVACGLSAGGTFAKGNSGGGGGGKAVGGGSRASSSSNAPAPAPAVHPGAAVGPINSGLPSSRSFRPVTISENGHRTLVYPGVSNSTVHRQGQSSLNAFKPGNAGNLSARSGKLSPASPTGLATKTKLDPQTSARLRHWNGNTSNVAQARLNNATQRHNHHGRDWWRRHCLAIIFFDWGWWGWYDGWWYPAWGYDPYSYYEYNQPIYGYGGFTPDQIVAGVQAALQQRGYYTYAVDGRMGPLTKAAIGRYQSEHRLPVSYGIDSATLGSLGILH